MKTYTLKIEGSGAQIVKADSLRQALTAATLNSYIERKEADLNACVTLLNCYEQSIEEGSEDKFIIERVKELREETTRRAQEIRDLVREYKI